MSKSILTKPIKGYEGLYEVSTDGTVWSLRFNKSQVRKPLKHIERNGYAIVALHKDRVQKMFLVHRLVADAFIPNPQNKPQVNHKNGVRMDASVENLEWCTNSENHKHAYAVLGRVPNSQPGEKHWKHKLTEKQVMDIIRLRGKYPQQEIGRMFGVAQTTIATIHSGKSWTYLKYNDNR